ncbi:Uncharacterized protein dnm_053040 [Desulfonema magnum]|uniref:Uncharacterized protein n=1 Tax=Desulfonema magnum TaxID=45655 RepID=A0A975BP25_9BACT|nr:Uncharacterized protein dnm_053040 [Desulfonema magnum]
MVNSSKDWIPGKRGFNPLHFRVFGQPEGRWKAQQGMVVSIPSISGSLVNTVESTRWGS